MKEPRIKWISEAFSMQPVCYRVGNLIDHVNKVKLDRIEHGIIMDTGDPFDCYDGFDEEGNLLFKMRKQGCNVGYF